MADSALTTGSSFSLAELVVQADPIVLAVVGLLAVASFLCWIIIIEKIYRIWRLRREVGTLETFVKQPQQAIPSDAVTAYAIIDSARQELTDIGSAAPFAEIRSRLVDAMRFTLIAELRQLETGLSFLATIGSTAPFIGLFGTVWGIIHSFSAIAQARDTSLAVVAPGIAEALFATAIGLLAAVPAVIAYNQILRELSRASQRMGSAVAAIAKAAARGRASQPGSGL